VTSTDGPSIPCVGAIVIDGAGRLLLVRRANPPAQGTWSIPGGRVEPDEEARDAVVRELAEETGLWGEVEREVGTVERPALGAGTYVIHDFLVRVADADELSAGDGPLAVRAADDALDAGWFTGPEVAALETSPGLRETLIGWGILEP